MSFSIQTNFPFQYDSYIGTYKSINSVDAPVLKSSNFIVDTGEQISNCFICSSVSGKLYIVLPSANSYKGRFLVFINQTENELISVDNLISLNPVSNVVSSTLSPTILNSYSQYFSILVSDGLLWYKMN